MVGILNKKGELTTQQIVLLIILIVSFAIILFFLIKLNLGNQSEEEVCHNSVILRGTSVVTDAVPLECKRQYKCISYDGTCEQMTDPDVIKVKTENEVYKALAEDMANCWWMFGEGKVNYVGSELIPDHYCSICSQIAFDNSVKDNIFNGSPEFDKKKLYNYLASQKRSDGKSYLNYLNLEGFNVYSGNFGVVNLEKQQYSLTSITSDVSTWGWIGIGAVGGAALVLSPLTASGVTLVSAVGLLTIGSGATAGALVAPVIEGSSGQQYLPPSLIEVNSQEFYDLNCESITTAS